MTTTRSATYGFRIPLFLVAGCLFHETDVSHAELPEPSIVLDVRTSFFADCIFSPDNRYLVDCIFSNPGQFDTSRLVQKIQFFQIMAQPHCITSESGI